MYFDWEDDIVSVFIVIWVMKVIYLLFKDDVDLKQDLCCDIIDIWEEYEMKDFINGYYNVCVYEDCLFFRVVFYVDYCVFGFVCFDGCFLFCFFYFSGYV